MQDNAAAIPEEFDMADLANHLTESEVEVIKADLEAEKAALNPAPEPKPEPVPETVAAPPVQIPDTTQAEADLAKLEGEMKALMDRYDDGELSRDDFQKQQVDMMRQAAQAQAKIDAAAAATTSLAEQRQAAWFKELDTFNNANADVAKILMSPQMIDDWDQALKAVNGSPAYAQLSHASRIELAYDMLSANVKATTGKPLPALAGKPAVPEPDPAGAEAGGPRNDPRPDAPQTLAGLNAADDRMVSDGQFAAIDKMMERDPLAAERMIAALTPDRHQAYMEQVGR